MTEMQVEAATESHETRESWLISAVNHLRPTFDAIGHPLPAEIFVSIGFPSTSRGNRIGECHHGEDGDPPHVFVHPRINDVVDVLAIVVHELIHAGGARGHQAEFREPMRALGLGGKPTTTTPGDMEDELRALAETLGPFPHTALNMTTKTTKKQGTRMMKVSCDVSGYVARTTKKWLEEYGPPLCPCCETAMQREEKGA